jgi:hypothetical protein
VLRV